MRMIVRFVGAVALASLLFAFICRAQKQQNPSPRIQSAQTVYFRNLTGSDAVGKNAAAELKKWGKYRLVADPKEADLILVLTADSTQIGKLVVPVTEQADPISDNEQNSETSVPAAKPSPSRYAYLTVIDRRTGETLWNDKHLWGGLLTGFNSAGERLIKELENQEKK